MTKNKKRIIELILEIKDTKELKRLKKRYKIILEDKTKMSEEEFIKNYPNCDYTKDEIEFGIKFINFILKNGI